MRYPRQPSARRAAALDADQQPNAAGAAWRRGSSPLIGLVYCRTGESPYPCGSEGEGPTDSLEQPRPARGRHAHLGAVAVRPLALGARSRSRPSACELPAVARLPGSDQALAEDVPLPLCARGGGARDLRDRLGPPRASRGRATRSVCPSGLHPPVCVKNRRASTLDEQPRERLALGVRPCFDSILSFCYRSSLTAFCQKARGVTRCSTASRTSSFPPATCRAPSPRGPSCSATGPVFAGDDFAVFSGDDVRIGLTALPWVDHPLVFWQVDDVEEAHRALVARRRPARRDRRRLARADRRGRGHERRSRDGHRRRPRRPARGPARGRREPDRPDPAGLAQADHLVGSRCPGWRSRSARSAGRSARSACRSSSARRTPDASGSRRSCPSRGRPRARRPRPG